MKSPDIQPGVGSLTRRDFLKFTAAGIAGAFLPSVPRFEAYDLKNVRFEKREFTGDMATLFSGINTKDLNDGVPLTSEQRQAVQDQLGLKDVEVIGNVTFSTPAEIVGQAGSEPIQFVYTTISATFADKRKGTYYLPIALSDMGSEPPRLNPFTRMIEMPFPDGNTLTISPFLNVKAKPLYTSMARDRGIWVGYEGERLASVVSLLRPSNDPNKHRITVGFEKKGNTYEVTSPYIPGEMSKNRYPLNWFYKEFVPGLTPNPIEEASIKRDGKLLYIDEQQYPIVPLADYVLVPVNDKRQKPTKGILQSTEKASEITNYRHFTGWHVASDLEPVMVTVPDLTPNAKPGSTVELPIIRIYMDLPVGSQDHRVCFLKFPYLEVDGKKTIGYAPDGYNGRSIPVEEVANLLNPGYEFTMEISYTGTMESMVAKVAKRYDVSSDIYKQLVTYNTLMRWNAETVTSQLKNSSQKYPVTHYLWGGTLIVNQKSSVVTS